MNELVLIIDGNWLLQSRLWVHEKLFRKDNPESMKMAGEDELLTLLSRSISGMLYKFPTISNAILVADGGSWRKTVPIPKQLQEDTYKGNRIPKAELDWDRIYKVYEKFVKNASDIGLTTSQYPGIEGDDWCWWWSRYCNEHGQDALIWSSDRDLQQLVQVDNQHITLWFNEQAGLVIPDVCEPNDDPLSFMLNPPFTNSTLVTLSHKIHKKTYINPENIVLNKVLCGDSGDNIKSAVRYKKGNKVYNFTNKDYNALLEDLKLTSIQDLDTKRSAIIEHILESKKFSGRGLKEDEVDEMLDYNLKLVWIDKSTIPPHLYDKMNDIEYKSFDVNQIKQNYKILSPTNPTTIEDLFSHAY